MYQTRSTEESRLSGLRWLVGTQNVDGSWGYAPRQGGFVEPTALAALALMGERAGAEVRDSLLRALAYLRQAQREDGGWGVASWDKESSWMSAYAVWALAAAPVDVDAKSAETVVRGAGWLLERARPMTLPESGWEDVRRTLRIDPALVGWPWVQADSSFIFPTALSVLAACTAGQRDHERVQDAVRLLLDRTCEGGGWNVGNPYMFGSAFLPTCIDTAVALVALKAAGEDGSLAARHGLKRLLTLSAETGSPLGLAWSALAQLAYGVLPAEVRSQLVAAQASDGGWVGNPFVGSLAVLALSTGLWLGQGGGV